MKNANVDTRKVFVGGISPKTDATSLKAFFEDNFGPVLECKIIYDHNTGRSKGYGFVTFSDMAHADLVKSATNTPSLSFCGKTMNAASAYRKADVAPRQHYVPQGVPPRVMQYNNPQGGVPSGFNPYHNATWYPQGGYYPNQYIVPQYAYPNAYPPYNYGPNGYQFYNNGGGSPGQPQPVQPGQPGQPHQTTQGAPPPYSPPGQYPVQQMAPNTANAPNTHWNNNNPPNTPPEAQINGHEERNNTPTQSDLVSALEENLVQ